MKRLLQLLILAIVSLSAVSVSAQTLADLVSQAAPSQFSRSLYIGLSGPDVSALQQKLKDLGFYAYPEITGWYGPVTAQAVSKFQQAYASEILAPNNLSQPTGTFGPTTRAKLASLSGSQPQAAIPAQAASADPGCPPGFNYSFLTGKPCARASASAPAAQVSKSTPGSSVSGRSSRSGGGSSRSSGSPSSSGSSNGSNNNNSSNPKPAKAGIIIPAGSGFAGPTPQPQTQGNPSQPGYDAKAIARWDVVPYQVFDTSFNVGVIAFHASDIDRVEFSANGGEWISVSKMTKNEQTGVAEYWATLRASDFPEGQVEIRAVAYPKVGIPRVLQGNVIQGNGEHSIFLNANSRGTLAREIRWVSPQGDNATGDGTEARPYKTIQHALWTIHHAQGGKADNGIIYLKAGDYAYSGGATGFGFGSPITKDGWITITNAPGTTRDQVRIVSGGTGQRINTSLIRFKNITLMAGLVTSGNLNQPSQLWWDNCLLVGQGQQASSGFENGSSVVYMTDSIAQNAMVGPSGVYISRNNIIKTIGSDAFQNVFMLINGQVDGIDRGATAAHPDILQYQGGITSTRENRIFYGLRSRDVKGAQGIFLADIGSIKDIALINLQVQSGNSTIGGSNPGHHVLMWHNTFSGNVFIGAAHQLAAGLGTNWSVRNNYFKQLIGGAEHAQANNVFDNNHYAGGAAIGTRATTGDARFISLENFDFEPGAASPLLGRVTAPLIPYDADGKSWREGDSIGALRSSFKASEPADSTPATQPQSPSGNQPSSPASQPDVVDGLVLRYAFDGSTQDTSGQNNNGTVRGDVSYATGRRGSAINFAEGNKAIITFSSTPNNTSHAVSFWMNSSKQNPGTVLGRSNGAAISVRFFNNNIRYGTVNSGAVDIPAGVTTDGWNHFVINRENAVVTVYKNGTHIGQGSLSANGSQGFNEIGVNGAGNSFYSGLLDDLRIYNRALSASEVQAIYNQ